MSNVDITIKILECAKNIFLNNGYEQVTLSYICNQVGITTGAIYRRFSGKEELFRSIVEPAAGELLRKLRCKQRTDNYSIFPEECLMMIYSNWDIFRIILKCRDVSFHNEFYIALEKSLYEGIMLERNKNEGTSYLRIYAVKAYLAALFEIIQKNYNFSKAWKCVTLLDNFIIL